MNELPPNIQNPENPENKEQPKKRILVVDDDEAIREVTSALIGILGYEVVTANDGQELLNRLNSGEAFDAVLTDQNMPVMAGVDALEQIRKDPKFDNLPITLWSSVRDSGIRSRVQKLNNARYIYKAGSLSVIKKTLEDMFEKTS